MRSTIEQGSGPANLSHRRRTVLALSASGLTSAEVADELQIPVAEVRADLIRAIHALGARSKLEAVIIALRYGLIAPQGKHPPDSTPLRA